MVDTLANFGFWELDARVDLILSTDQASKRLGVNLCTGWFQPA
jgi:hypothetical protein